MQSEGNWLNGILWSETESKEGKHNGDDDGEWECERVEGDI